MTGPGSAITNYSENPTRRLDIEVTIAFGADVRVALEALRKLLASEPRVLAEPSPEAMVVNYAAQGVTLNVRCWTKADDYWNVRFAFYQSIKHTLEAVGCAIAVPVHEVRGPEQAPVPGAAVTPPPPQPRPN